MIKNLEKVFERKSILSRLYVRKKLLTLKYKQGTELQKIFVEFDCLICDLESTGTTIEEDDKVCHLLLTMTDTFGTVITVLETSNDKLTVDFVKAKLLDAELKLKNNETVSEESSFYTKQDNKKPRCSFCGLEGHLVSNCFRKNNNYRVNSSKGRFFRGNNYSRGRRTGNNTQSKHNIHAKVAEDEVSFITALSAEDLKNDDNQISFIIDSGASQNMCSGKYEQFISNIVEIETVGIKIANGRIMNSCKKGMLKVYYNEIPINIDVLILNNLEYNQLSVIKLNNLGFTVVFKENTAEIRKNHFKLICCKHKSNLFVANFHLNKVKSHFSVVYLMTRKCESESHLINHIEKLAAEGRRVSRIIMDMGGEMSSKMFKNYCVQHGIVQEFTARYTPQQNSIAEQFNRTILDKVRAMFVETNLPKSMWGEAVRTAVYQLNRTPSRAIELQVPAEIYLNRLDLSKLKVFGSKVWYNLPKKSKLEPRASKGVMVGYSGAGYRIWNPLTNQIKISRDVVFDESQYKYSSEILSNNQNTEEILPSQDELEILEETIYEDSRVKTLRNITESNSQDEEPVNVQTTKTSFFNREIKPPSKFKDYELYYAYCLVTSTPVLMKKQWRVMNGSRQSKQNLNVSKKWTPGLKPQRYLIINKS
ncbi:unnamed protein product [Diabrotica balteata]|uniref:Integrase catalytic domain-containing protein n=1 Tax=Diabrotica balteata TaxID=107213 RepID=A0A9N9SVB5_DIABA|nr:unnamed protein product [Diabrotica balteata]